MNGGAISYFTTDRHGFASFRNCFIEYAGQIDDVNERDIEFLFEENKATLGNSIYTTTIEHCRRHLNCTTDPSTLFSCITKFTYPNDDVNSASYQLATAGENFVVENISFPLPVIPGKL